MDATIEIEENKYKLMIVEDESIVAMDLCDQLELMGYQVCAIADNGLSAVKLAQEHAPDLIMMDIVIKGDMDGIDTATEINRLLRIPIIFLTAFTDDTTVNRATKAAPYGYISKPYNPKEIQAALKVAIYKSQLEKNLRSSEQWFSTTLRCVADAVVATDSDSKVKYINPAAENLLGITSDAAIGKMIDNVVIAENPRTGLDLGSFASQSLKENKVVGLEYGILLKSLSGNQYPVDYSAAPIRDESGSVLGSVLAFRDVSKRLQAEQELRSSEERFRMAFQNAPVGMALVSLEGKYLQVNQSMCEIVNVSESKMLEMHDTDFTFTGDRELEQRMLLSLVTGEKISVQYEKRYQVTPGATIWVLMSVSLLTQNEDPFCYLYQIHNLTERKYMEQRLNYLAHHDTLTNLFNRGKFLEEIEKDLLLAKRNSQASALIFIDLDHFKQVNDTLGHDVGDKLLIMAAHTLKKSLRETDLIARFGGDEFVIYLPNFHNENDVLQVANQIWDNFNQPFQINQAELRIGCSMGVSIYPSDAANAQELLRCADSALYQAKSEGRNNLQFYRLELTERLDKKIKLEQELKSALDNGEFELFYQPIIPNKAQFNLGAEALIRWNHPTRGQVMPLDFISFAEENGMIVQIGKWVIQQACKEAAKWQNNSEGTPIEISINVSPKQFKTDNILKIVTDALVESGLSADLLTLEVTEELFLNDTDHNLKIISALKEIGVKIAIDDFGIGYSSLSYIKLFSPDKLKIDRSFISDIVSNSESRIIVKAIIAMATSLNIQVVSEGVETLEISNLLKSKDCDSEQGFYYSRPINANSFAIWLKNQIKPI